MAYLSHGISDTWYICHMVHLSHSAPVTSAFRW